MPTHKRFAVQVNLLFLSLFLVGHCVAQGTQPLNSNISDFGTSFIFSAPPICKGCVEAELGGTSLQSSRFVPIVLTVAPFSTKTDFSILTNTFESTSQGNARVNHSAQRLDFVIRQQVLDKNGLTLTLAPRGTVFLRDVDSGRVGGTFAGQYTKGLNTEVVNATLTRSTNPSDVNPRWDRVISFDYYRTLNPKGFAVFVGTQHESMTHSSPTYGVEQGMVIPFRDGQVELAVEELNLNTKPTIQLQVRVIALWSKVFRK